MQSSMKCNEQIKSIFLADFDMHLCGQHAVIDQHLDGVEQQRVDGAQSNLHHHLCTVRPFAVLVGIRDVQKAQKEVSDFVCLMDGGNQWMNWIGLDLCTFGRPVDDIEISQSILREHRKSMTNSLRKSTAHSEDFIQQIRRHSSVSKQT